MRRVLQPGGRILIADFQPATGRAARYLTGLLFAHAIAERPLDQVKTLIRAAGFAHLIHNGSVEFRWSGRRDQTLSQPVMRRRTADPPPKCESGRTCLRVEGRSARLTLQERPPNRARHGDFATYR